MILQRISKRSLLLLVFDLAAIPAAFMAAIYLRNGALEFFYLKHPLIILSFFIYISTLYTFDFYYPFKYFKPAHTAIETLYIVAVGSVFLFSVSYLDRSFLLQRITLLLAILFMGLFIFCSRMVYDIFFRSRYLDKKALIVGTGPFAREIYQIIKNTPHAGIRVVGLVSESDVYKEKGEGDLQIVGSVSRLLTLIQWHHVGLVILAMEYDRKSSEPDIMYALLKQNVQVVSGVGIFEELDEAIPYQVVDEHFLLGLMSEVKTHNYLKIKRMVDLIFSVLLLIVFSPVIVLITVILLTGGIKNVLFIQERIGKDNKIFKLIKFKSMTEKHDGKMYITHFGKWMRKYRIDEIPQLINVFKGDMSLIGPRPEIPYFVEKCREGIPFYDVTFSVKPGITGWAQVKFFHVTEFRDYKRKFQYNLYYLKNLSLTLDLLILFKTVRIMLMGGGK